MANKRIAGMLEIKFTTASGNTGQVAVRGSWTISPSRTEKEGIAGQDYVHGFKEVPRVPFMEGDASYLADVDIQAIDEGEDFTVIGTLANGHRYMGSDGWRAEATEIESEDGKFKLRFEFDEIRRLA